MARRCLGDPGNKGRDRQAEGEASVQDKGHGAFQEPEVIKLGCVLIETYTNVSSCVPMKPYLQTVEGQAGPFGHGCGTPALIAGKWMGRQMQSSQVRPKAHTKACPMTQPAQYRTSSLILFTSGRLSSRREKNSQEKSCPRPEEGSQSWPLMILIPGI